MLFTDEEHLEIKNTLQRRFTLETQVTRSGNSCRNSGLAQSPLCGLVFMA
jgi:hypothetical protein